MRIEYRTKKLKEECENPEIAQKRYGKNIGNMLTQRVGELAAATNLLDVQRIPSVRLHKLKGKRKNQYAVDLKHPHRLIFTPVQENNIDIELLQNITAIRLEEVVDYHDKQKR